jgi:hypothetical protein
MNESAVILSRHEICGLLGYYTASCGNYFLPGKRCKQLLDDLKEKRRYWNLKEKSLEHTV